MEGDRALAPTLSGLIQSTSSPSAPSFWAQETCLTHAFLCTSVIKAQVVPVLQIFWAFSGP